MNQLLAVVVVVFPASTLGVLCLRVLARASFARASTPSARAPIAHRLSRGLLLASVIAITLAVSQRGVHAAGPPTISISPATATTGIGGNVPLDIDAANVSTPGLGGYVIVLQWNPAVLSLTSLADAGWVTSGQIIVLCTTATIDNTNGTAELDCTPVYGFGTGVTTSTRQALAHALFHAKASGTTSIDLTGSSLLDPVGVDIISTLTNGSVTVGATSVGGIAEEPDVAALPARAGDGPSGTTRFYAAAAALGALALAGGAAWMRRTKRR